MKNEEQHPYRCPPALKSLKCLAAALVLSLTLSPALPAYAVVPVPIGGLPNGPLYAVAGITADQILRLTLVNVARSPAASAAGHSQILDEPFSTTTTTSARSAPTPNRADLPTRVLLRPIINLVPNDPCRGIRTTLSVNDATTQQPLAIIPGTPIHPMNPLFEDLSQAFPPTPIRYSFLTTQPTDPMHIHVTNAFIPQEPISPPIQVKMGFQTADGVILQPTVISLMPGKSATLIQTTFPPDPIRPIISVVPVPVGGIVTSVELVDALSARTMFFYPPGPFRGSLAFNPSRTED